MARAALCGDISRRGSIIGDHDVPALEAILESVAAGLAVPFVANDDAWVFTIPDTVDELTARASLTVYLADALVATVAPDSCPFPEPPVFTSFPPIRPHW